MMQSAVKCASELPYERIMTAGILTRLANGEREAMQECIDQYGNLIWGITRRFFSDMSLAEDIVQEILTEIWNKSRTYNPAVASESTFVALIARRRSIDALRKLRRRPSMEPLPETDVSDQANYNYESSPERPVGVEEISKAMGQISGETRQLIELSIQEGFTHQEISEQLNMPLGTVKTKIRRGLLELRNQLQKSGCLAMESGPASGKEMR